MGGLETAAASPDMVLLEIKAAAASSGSAIDLSAVEITEMAAPVLGPRRRADTAARRAASWVGGWLLWAPCYGLCNVVGCVAGAIALADRVASAGRDSAFCTAFQDTRPWALPRVL